MKAVKTAQGFLFVEHESSHPRGFWLPQDQRYGTTASDPRRYKRLTQADMIARGEAEGDDAPDVEGAIFDLWNETEPARQEGLYQYASVRPSNILGRQRQYKLQTYEAARGRIESALEDAGFSDTQIDESLHRWDEMQDVRVVEDTSGRIRIYDGEHLLFDDSPDRLRRVAEHAAGQLAEAADDLRRDIAVTLIREARHLGDVDEWTGIDEDQWGDLVDADPEQALRIAQAQREALTEQLTAEQLEREGIPF